MERDGTRKESKVKRAKRRGGGGGKREESSSKKGGCRFSNCNETRHRRVAWVSYDDQTTDDDAVFLSPRILLFIPYDTNFVFRGNCKPAANYQVILFHILPYSHTLSINEIKEINFKNRVFNYFQIFQYSPFSEK